MRDVPASSTCVEGRAGGAWEQEEQRYRNEEASHRQRSRKQANWEHLLVQSEGPGTQRRGQ